MLSRIRCLIEYEHVRYTFVILTDVRIGVIYRIHFMIGPDPPTQFILYVFYGVNDCRLSRSRKDIDVILCMVVCGYLCVV